MDMFISHPQLIDQLIDRMKKTIVVVAFLVIYSVVVDARQLTIPIDECTWRTGHFGEHVHCERKKSY